MMKITYDTETDALYIQLRDIPPGHAINKDLEEGITADYDSNGILSGIEILDASEILDIDQENLIVELTPIRKKAV